MRLLLVEDSERLRRSLARGLRREGYAVDLAADGREGLWHASENAYDVIVLDLMLPAIDGLTVLRTLRERGISTYVLILSAKDMVEDRVQGLSLGADDYLVKPFSFAELCARIQALVRRSYGSKSPVLRVGELTVDTGSRRVSYGNQTLSLTPREYSLIELLVRRAGDVVGREELWEHLYEFDSATASNVIEVMVYSLRRKLGPGADLIKTRRGQGYIVHQEERGET
ncbi:MAG TPA: response regulator transcription factor [Thermoanaerobaculia bacterium]|nr:response regulator transcription factor [Thermoanaerobaculia bacterium]